MSGKALSLDSVDKIYHPGSRNAVHAVKALNLAVDAGEIVALLGSSGCGKTSTLRMIAGFETVTAGSVRVDNKAIHELAPAKRGVAMAFEGYSLYPPLSVRENIGFALQSQRVAAHEIRQRVDAIAQLLEIDTILDRYPSSISGGEQQRASLARALVRDAKLHLLDEPMGQLEPQLRALLRGRIKHYVKERDLTVILVTHDQTEANALADRIAVMEDGSLMQFASPEVLRERPANLFTGTFIGEPPMNVLRADVSDHDGQIVFSLSATDHLQYPRETFAIELRDRLLQARQIDVGVRPHAVKPSEQGLRVQISANQWLGDQSHLAASVADHALVSVTHERVHAKPNDYLNVALEAKDLHLFDIDSGEVIAHGTQMV